MIRDVLHEYWPILIFAAFFLMALLSGKIGDWAFDERQREYESELQAEQDAKQAFWDRLNDYGDGGTNNNAR